MITVSGSVTTPLSPEQAAAYLFEFEHTSEWDPGTPVVNKISIGPARPGSRYYAEAEFRGKRQPIEYEILQLSGRHIKLRGENQAVIAYDSIDISPDGSGSEVKYTAEFELRGWRKLFTPVAVPLFNSLRDPAMNGLQKRLDSLQ